jgi:hypothetical protein
MPQTLAVLLVLGPAGTDQIAAHDRFHRQRLETFDHHGATGHLIPFFSADHAFRRIAGQLVRHDVRQLANQKSATAVSTWPLPGIGVGNTTSKADRRSVVTISMRWSSMA